MAALPPCDSGTIATLRQWRRIWAVAAIHGEAERLGHVLDGLSKRSDGGDRIVFLGNYLGHGPDVAGGIDRLIAFRRDFLSLPGNFPGDIVFLRGWQEEVLHKLLELHFAGEPGDVFRWMLDHGMAATLGAYGADPALGEAAMREGGEAIARWTDGLRAAIDSRNGHRPFFTGLRHAARTDDGKLLFVHAGFDSGTPLAQQNDSLWWGGDDILTRAAPFPGGERLVRGFDRQHGGLKLGPHAISLDGGAGFGGPLLAACFDRDGTLIESLSG